MPHFSQQVFHMGGVPVGGDFPTFIGNSTYPVYYYHIDQLRGASGGGSGSVKDPYSTIAAAVTAANATIDWSISPWAPNHVFLIRPGTYAENLTSLPYGCTMIGMGLDTRDAQNGVKIKPASGDAVDCNAVINTTFRNICFESVDAAPAFDAAICNNNQFINCRFQGAAESVTCASGFYTNDAVANWFYHCTFTCCAKGMDIAYADGGDSFSHNLIEDCTFTQNTTGGIYTSTNLVGPSTVVKNCSFTGSGQTMVYAVYDQSTMIDVVGCNAETTSGYSCRSVNGSYNLGALVT